MLPCTPHGLLTWQPKYQSPLLCSACTSNALQALVLHLVFQLQKKTGTGNLLIKISGRNSSNCKLMLQILGAGGCDLNALVKAP